VLVGYCRASKVRKVGRLDKFDWIVGLEALEVSE
jgi:hypothetical protein